MSLDDSELVRQIGDILRLQVGEEIILLDGSGTEARCAISAVRKRDIEVDVIEKSVNTDESSSDVTLYCAIAKGDTFEWIVEKATEAGVKRIVPMVTARTVKKDVRADRLTKIMREAAEVAGRGLVPVLNDVLTFAQAVQEAAQNGKNYFFDVDGDELNQASSDKIGIFIGPEGGWSDEEVALAKSAGFSLASLGGLTLRAETAATIASYLVVHT